MHSIIIAKKYPGLRRDKYVEMQMFCWFNS